MTHIHYKFSSKLSYNTVVFDGANITLGELKRLIMAREKLRANDCDLQITNAQTKEEYTDDNSQIPKGSSVIVRRVPSRAVKSSSSAKSERSEAYNYSYGIFKPTMDGQKTAGVLPIFSKMANLASADVSEECKIKAIMNQSGYDSSNYKRYGATLPANYTCYRCGSIEHHIRNCPMSTQDKNAEPPLRIKKSTGIPRSFMVRVDDPNLKGALLTNSGHYAIPAIDAEAYAVGKKKIPTQEQQTKEPPNNSIPDELLCLICRDLLNDAVVIPCCGNSYCDDCIRCALLDSEDHVCPTCNQSDVSPDTLIANKFLRQAVNNFKKEQGCTQSFKKSCSSSQSQECTPRPSPAPTPPLQSQPEKSQAADTPTVTTSDSTPSSSSTSLIIVKILDETPNQEADMKTNSSPAASPSVLVSDPDTGDSQSQPIPLVTSVTQTAVVDDSNSGSTSQSGQAPYWDRSASAAPSEGWTTLSTHHPTSSLPTFSPTQSSNITPSHIQTYLSVHQQPLRSYLPGFSTTTPSWTPGPSPQGAPIPLFTSSSTTSIPPLLPKELFLYHRRNKERTSSRGSSYNPSLHFSSKSQKSKSSRSSSRSPSRSRSHGRSRPESPYFNHRDLSSRSHSSHSYSHKRSHSPTTSSSPRSRHQCRSKSPLDHHKSRHHSRHNTKRSKPRSSSMRSRGESSYTSRESPDWSLDTYLRWKQEYKDWCEKYFNSYFSHFHQMPPPLLTPPPQPHWPSHSHSFTGHSPPSSDSRSSTSQSYSESSSTPSQFSSNSHSSTPYSDGHSTPTQSSSDSNSSSSDGSSGPSQEPSKVYQHRNMVENQNKEKESETPNSGNCSLKSSSKNKHLKSKSDDKKRKLLDEEKERKKHEEKEEKWHRVKASQKLENIDADRRRQSGHSKLLDSRSDKNKMKKNEETLRNQRENNLTEPSSSFGLFPKLVERGKQKKAVWKSQPITEEDVWEHGAKVKPQKKISININLDIKKKEETNANKPDADANKKIQEVDSHTKGEKSNNQTDNDVNKTENKVEEKLIPDEETRDKKNDSWEIFAEDEAVGEEDSELWQCALTAVEEEEGKAKEEESVVIKDEEMESKEQEDNFKSQRNMIIDNSRWESESCEGDQKTVVKCLEEYMEKRSLKKHSEHVQVTHSRWEKDGSEKEHRVQVPSDYREIKGRSKRRRLVEIENDEEMDNSNSTNRSAVPSSGQDITDNNFDFDRKGKKMTERGSESRKGEERVHHREKITYSTINIKSPTGSSQAFTSILEKKKSSNNRDQNENRSRERSSRQIYVELDIQWRGKSDKSIPYSNYHHHNSHQDLTLNLNSDWTSLHSHSKNRDRGQLPSKTSIEDSPGQNWTSRRPATPIAESSLGMALDMEKSKERMTNERIEERMQNRQNEGQVDSERPSCSTNASHNDSKNERRKDKKTQKSQKGEETWHT